MVDILYDSNFMCNLSYCTRVGEGPFPTEVNGTVCGDAVKKLKVYASVGSCESDALLPPQIAEFLRERGSEYGTTTSRPRRVGWIDVTQV